MCNRITPLALCVWGLCVALAQGRGVVIPEEKLIAPFTMVSHHAVIQVEDQVTQVRLEQVFENPTSRNLEATYWFPVPKGAAVSKFSMWVDGKEVKGELVEANKARETYQNIVRRTMDPGLLEFMDAQWVRLKVFPVPAHGKQKVALEYVALAKSDNQVVEILYPWKGEWKNSFSQGDFSLKVSLKSQLGIGNVYSPSHGIVLDRKSNREVAISLERSSQPSPRDFQLFYTLENKDLNFQCITHRPLAGEDGYFALLMSPGIPKDAQGRIARDVVMVMDTSGSMRGPKMEQARKAMKYCLNTLQPEDSFGLINFATAVNCFRPDLVKVNDEFRREANQWVEALESTGGTAIHDALQRALEMRKGESKKPFVVIFFTDGLPTVGITDPDKILQSVQGKLTTNTRIFTFGVGDDVNAVLLDSLAEQSRALATYVRPQEDIEQKTSGMVSKIERPALVNLKMEFRGDIQALDEFPRKLPDLYSGGQVVVLGRFKGKGIGNVMLTGMMEKGEKTFEYAVSFPERTDGSRKFLEPLWARMKVAFLLDQIRANGEKKELVEEVIALSTRHGITTPYTSYLVVPDGPVAVPLPRPRPPFPHPIPYPLPGVPRGLLPPGASGEVKSVLEFARESQEAPGQILQRRNVQVEQILKQQEQAGGALGADARKKMDEISDLNRARTALLRNEKAEFQGGKLGVDLSVQNQNFKQHHLPANSPVQAFGGKNLVESGGVWVDEAFTPKMPVLIIKAQSEAYFQMLDAHPELAQLLSISNHLVWVGPSGKALVIDASQGSEKVSSQEIESLFLKK